MCFKQEPATTFPFVFCVTTKTTKREAERWQKGGRKGEGRGTETDGGLMKERTAFHLLPVLYVWEAFI